MEDVIEVLDANITIRSILSFLTDVKNKLQEPGNENRKTLFRATVFGKWLDILAFINDNHLLNYIFHHRVSAESSSDCPPITYRIYGDNNEFGRKEFCLITGFLFGELPKKETYKVSTIVFMVREPRYYISDNVLESVEDLPGFNTYPWGEYFWRIFYLRTLNVVLRKSERDSKKNKDIVIFILEIFPNSNYSWKKDPTMIPHGISWSIIEKFHKGDYTRLFAHCSKPLIAFAPSDYESVQPWCVDSFKYFNNMDEPGPRDNSNNHSDVHAEDQDSPFQNMDMDVNIHSDVHVEEQNSPVMEKEDLLAVFDGIKATIHIIDKRKGEVATSCLVKELDLVKDRIAVIEKALKLRYQESSEDSVQQQCYKQHELGGSKDRYSVSVVFDVCHQVVASETHHCAGEGSGFIYADSQDQFSVSQLLQVSIGFDNVLDPDCKDEFGYDNDQEGLVKLVDDLCSEEHISGNVVDAKVVDEKVLDDKVLDKKLLDAKVVDEKGQAISCLTATEDQHLLLITRCMREWVLIFK
uniref:Phospholipase-like protein n=1 Tax=Tanacetum cinerariifolium TaxID=118510 RepID=A0A699IAM9_TANCI|nr:hypothetical protein [Tanacetum cinerariifolium]